LPPFVKNHYASLHRQDFSIGGGGDIVMFFQNFMKKHKEDPYDKEKKLKFSDY
jgi:hypothetical protein